MKLFAGLLCCLLASGMHAQSIQGFVFEDHDRNGLHNEKDKALSSVSVSDGYSVVQTKNNGSFEITPDPNARFLFVTLPSGYKALTKYYIPLTDTTRNCLFPLAKDAEQDPDSLKFIQITDTETPIYGPWIDNIRNFSQLQRAALIVHTGDICYEPGLRFHAAQVNAELLGRPIYYCVGNHDLVKGEYGEKLFEELFGPAYYSFEAGPAHFVVTPMANGDFKPDYTTDQVIRWLKKDLALKDPGKPLIFLNHNFTAGDDFILHGEKEAIDLKAYNLKAWLFGHRHNNYIAQKDGVYVVNTGAPNKGGIDNSAGQFLVLDIDKKGVKQIKPVYTGLHSYIEMLESAVDKATGLDSHFPVDVVVYETERTIQKVSADLYDKEGNRMVSSNLLPIGDWHWQQKMPVNTKGKAAAELWITVIYTNGQYDIRKQKLNDLPDVKTAPLKIVWRKTIDGSIWKTSPLVIDNRVYIGTMTDGSKPQYFLVALNKANGKEIWKVPTSNSVKQALQYRDGILLATDVAGKVYALDATNGKIKWTKAITSFGSSPFVSGPALSGDTYYTGLGRNMQALDVKTGEVRWKSTTSSRGGATAAAFYISKDLLFAGVNWDALYAYDKETGVLRWKRDDEGLRFRSGGVTVVEDTVYVAGLNSLFKLDAKTGKTFVQNTSSANDFRVMANPLVSKDLVVMPTATDGVKAFDRTTLEERWHFQTEEAIIYTAPYATPDRHKKIATVESSVIAFQDKLLFGASDGYFYVLDRTGKLLQKINLGVPVLAEPTIDGNRVYVADFSGTVSCFQIQSRKYY